MQLSHSCLADYQRDGYALVRELFSNDQAAIARIARELLHDEVYLHSSAVLSNGSSDGGAWEWRQDYGFSYTTGCLAPTMVSCMIAGDRSTQEQSSLQVLRGSHTLGRIDHERSGEQFVADPERVRAAIDILERQVVTLAPGDALFFHCNLLHRLEAHGPANGRRNVIYSYNTERNRPRRAGATSITPTLARAMSELGHFASHVPLGWR
jgi:ectoine hydroxylase-related dioxygenase (phytanoyl-CoA dioxygenase family)